MCVAINHMANAIPSGTDVASMTYNMLNLAYVGT